MCGGVGRPCFARLSSQEQLTVPMAQVVSEELTECGEAAFGEK
jgi:hypothetical protein